MEQTNVKVTCPVSETQFSIFYELDRARVVASPVPYDRRDTVPTASHGMRDSTAADIRLRVESLRPDTVRMHQLKSILNDLGLAGVISSQVGSPSRRSRLDIINELRENMSLRPLSEVDPRAVTEFKDKLAAKVVLDGSAVPPSPVAPPAHIYMY